ncbi:succinate semialdehyde dehydrogenase [Tindallia magadiensis]|uniref:Succinate semialdehyde dehydrogenase n=1 Tax=Tindallia magadiensis TaxID=69895 RepID=A0A1I3GT54_9FIRM|nr:NAD-dependent succinate-semialdehyde dehydrogenase [Tindallia magadiensis]SFI26688.1 succinate semialdehyde dehydrogenase [Tindallia magadiensis]
MRKEKLYINGQWQEAASGETFDVLNPADGSLVGKMASAGREEVLQAITAAEQALEEWASLPAQVRANYMKKWHQLLLEKAEKIARTLTMEQGKPLAEALGEVKAAAAFVEWYAEEGKRVYGETIPASSSRKRILVLKQPVGITAAITPWNFPASMVTRKISPAIAAGCPVILKPAEQTPFCAVEIIQLAHEAGIPKGVISLLTGPPEVIGDTLLEDPRIRKVTFTGSTAVGKKLMKKSADTVKQVSLELGGHAPYLVFEDADLDKAVKELIGSKIRNCGQICIATNRLYVQESVEKELVQKLKTAFSGIKMGSGFEEDIQMGPLIDEKAYQKVQEHVEDALSKGATIVTGGEGFHRGEHEKAGYYYKPTILVDVTADMNIMKEETFGPVVPIQRFQSEEEALRLANDSHYGLASYVFTESLSRGLRVSEKLEYGIVGLNDGGPATVQAPFGGIKESGLGREGGHFGIESFLEIKYLSIGIE